MLRVRGERRGPNEILDNLVYPPKKSVHSLRTKNDGHLETSSLLRTNNDGFSPTFNCRERKVGIGIALLRLASPHLSLPYVGK